MPPKKNLKLSAMRLCRLSEFSRAGNFPAKCIRTNSKIPFSFLMVPWVGVEPTSLSRHHFKWCAYTNSATRAFFFIIRRPRPESNRRIRVLQTLDLPLVYVAVIICLIVSFICPGRNLKYSKKIVYFRFK